MTLSATWLFYFEASFYMLLRPNKLIIELIRTAMLYCVTFRCYPVGPGYKATNARLCPGRRGPRRTTSRVTASELQSECNFSKGYFYFVIFGIFALFVLPRPVCLGLLT